MNTSFYKIIESINKYDTMSFLSVAFILLLILVLIRNGWMYKTTNELFDDCELKIAKITDAIGNICFKIVISENKGSDYLFFQDYLNLKSYSLGPIFSYSRKEFKSVCSSFNTLEEAVNELYKFRLIFGQSNFENKMELQ